MSILAKARELAEAVHAQQVDKAGRPYINHPARVAARLAGDELAEAVAWLHDVVEDTAVTAVQLAELGFPAAVVDAVVAVTRIRGEQPGAYYGRIAANELALRVKLADIADNSDPARLARLDEATRARLSEKYAKALAALSAAAPAPVVSDVPVQG